MRRDTGLFGLIYCDNNFNSMFITFTNFASTNVFFIGKGFIGLMRDFKLFTMPLAGETFTQATTSKLYLTSVPSDCPSGQYFSADTSTCLSCDPLCAECTSGQNGDCLSCVGDASLSSGVCSCNPGRFWDDPTCKCKISLRKPVQCIVRFVRPIRWGTAPSARMATSLIHLLQPVTVCVLRATTLMLLPENVFFALLAVPPVLGQATQHAPPAGPIFL